MADRLKGRLARLRKLGLVSAAELGKGSDHFGTGDRTPRPSRVSADARESASFLGDWERVGDLTWTRTLRFGDCLPDSVDPLAFAPLRRDGPRKGAAPSEPVGAERVAAASLRFFDLETTGLSGGTGTIAFLAAVGRLLDGDFAVTQVFLEDYPGEADFLAALLPLLEGEAIVSYNGKAFDVPLLRTRCVMNGVAAPQPVLHIDALFAARRLWRRVHGGASLGLLEREVLGIERAEDLPGAAIPGAWLDFARAGDSPLMRLVVRHNADDVVGLARLLATSQAVFDAPRSFLARSDVDRAGLGRSLLAAGRDDLAEELLEAAAADGDEMAGLLLSRRFRRGGRAEDGIRLAAMLPATYRCALERARVCERLMGDLAESMRWAEEARRLARNDEEAHAARTREKRLERKLARGRR